LRKGNDSEEANVGEEDAVDYELLLHSDEDPKTSGQTTKIATSDHVEGATTPSVLQQSASGGTGAEESA